MDSLTKILDAVGPHKHLGHYKLDTLLGKGTFSDVYKGTNEVTKEVIALKCFRKQMEIGAHYRTAAKEIAFMRILKHPNILPLKMFEINSIFVIIGTEYAAFGSLKTFLEKNEIISEPTIKNIMQQIVSALDYMHVLGIFHGDLKPHNILCTKVEANVPLLKICDFGLTSIKLKGCIMTYTGGSFMFMAPEVHCKFPVDVTCDLWSVGVIMYYMMFKRNIFNLKEQEKEKHISFLKKRVTPDYSGFEKFSPDCNHLLRGLLNYNKQHRLLGVNLRKHPFLNLGEREPINSTFFTDANFHLETAFAHFRNKKYGDALVNGIQAVLEFKIYHNICGDTNFQKYLRKTWMDYEDFTLMQERALVIAPRLDFDANEINDFEFRKVLMSTPKLLDGFDIGCNAKMFLIEGNKEKAINMFHQALNILLPLMKTEPPSLRKDILGKRIKEWIEQLEHITKGHEQSSHDTETLAAGIASIPNLSRIDADK